MNTIRPFACAFDRPIRLGVLISGGGRTLLNLVEHIEAGLLPAEVTSVLTSRDCPGVQRAAEVGLGCRIIPRNDFDSHEAFSETVFAELREQQVDLVVLAGFLSLLRIPDDFLYRVINVHPALIPAFCGHGNYGSRVHRAAIERGVKVSGCTIHFADQQYDHGPIILQKAVPVLDDDTADSLAARVFEAECEVYPEAIKLLLEGRLEIIGRRVRVH